MVLLHMVHASITHIEKKIARWEGQELLMDADWKSALKMPEKLIELRKELKMYRVTIIDQVGNEEMLEEEQKTFRCVWGSNRRIN